MRTIDLDQMYEDALKDVKICCDENHSHNALSGCLVGDPHAVNVCKLWEYIQFIRSGLVSFHHNVEKVLK